MKTEIFTPNAILNGIGDKLENFSKKDLISILKYVEITEALMIQDFQNLKKKYNKLKVKKC